MIITDDFVYLVYPKTASAFTREVLDEIHLKDSWGVRFVNRKLKKYYYPSFYKRMTVEKIEVHNRKGQPTEHGLYIQIPEKHKNKPIFTVARSPYDRLVSLYTFRDWEKTGELLISDYVMSKFPHYPNLSFEEFVDALYTVNPLVNDPKFKLKEDIGPLTIQFILFYFKNPYEVLNEKLSTDYFSSNKFKADMPAIDIANMSSLATDLKNYLLKFGYTIEQLQFIDTKGKTNVSRKDTKSHNDFYTPELFSFINHKERYLLQICQSLNLDM